MGKEGEEGQSVGTNIGDTRSVILRILTIAGMETSCWTAEQRWQGWSCVTGFTISKSLQDCSRSETQKVHRFQYCEEEENDGMQSWNT